MATTGIWKIEKRLDHVIDYTMNIEKTVNINYGKEDYYELHGIKDYTNLDFKTEKQYYVSSLNCSVETVYEEMMITKKQYNKVNGILGFHAFQSFAEGEVTPEKAHEIGVQLAKEMWGDRFEVVISTHVNTNHIHNHFVVNSVSFSDGKKYYDNRSTYSEFRSISDSLCEEYGLSVLKEKACPNSKINFANYYNNYVENNNYYTTTKEDIDRAIAQAYSYKDFENLMCAMDYYLIYRNNVLSVRRPPYKKNIRVQRCYGIDYTREAIEKRIATTQDVRIPFIEEYGISKKRKSYTFPKKNKKKGLYGLYLHYCYLLKVFPKANPRKILPASIRVDVKELDNISKQTELLVSNNIETYEQFFLYKTEKEKRLDELLDKRSKLWYKHKKAKNDLEKKKIREEIDKTSKEIIPLQEIQKLCAGIEERAPKIEKNIKEYESKEGKEMFINECIK